MTNTYKLLGSQEVASASTDVSLYTVPASTQTIVKHMRVVNNDAGLSHTFKMWHSEDGNAVSGDDELIVPEVSLDAGGWGEFEGTIIMEAGDQLLIEVNAANSITVFVYGLEIGP